MEQLGQDDPKSMQRLIWATLAMAVIFGAWTLFMGPPKSSPPAKPAADGPQKVETAAPAAKVQAGEAAPAAVAGESERTLTLENADLRLVVSNKGGVLQEVRLKHFREKNGPEDDLVSPLSKLLGVYPLAITTGDEVYDKLVGTALFHVEQTPGPAGETSVQLTWSDGKGNSVMKALSLPPSGYEATLSVSATKDGKPLGAVPLSWGPGFGKLLEIQAKNRYYQQEYVGIYEAGSYTKVQKARVKEQNPVVAQAFGAKGPMTWAAITNNYFAAVFLPEAPMASAKVVTHAVTAEQRKVHPADSDIQLVVDFPGKGRLFMGPKEWHRLQAMGDHFYKLSDWGLLWPICAFLLWAMKKLYQLFANYGVAILMLTLLIKVGFYPLTQSSMVKMKEMGEAMKKLKPQIDRIKGKYKKLPKDMATRGKMNEEVMALYQREGINPLGGMSGCLPLLLQMPIFFALFTMLPRAIELRGAAFFGWIHDLSVPDPYFILPILMGVSMVASTRMTATQGMEGAQKMLLWFMPIMFTWICFWAPAGLTLYWLANNILTMGQQAIINRQVARRQEDAAKGRRSTPKGPSKPSH